MSGRVITIIGALLIVVGVVEDATAEMLCGAINGVAREVKRRQCWPDPFVAPDRATVRAPFAVQVENGWKKQNMLGEFHFEPNTGQLTEAGRLKVRWIMDSGPKQHRLIYVHHTGREEETSARIEAVQQLAGQISPHDVPPILPTAIPDEGWPADLVEAIGRKYQNTIPSPRLPDKKDSSSGQTQN